MNLSRSVISANPNIQSGFSVCAEGIELPGERCQVRPHSNVRSSKQTPCVCLAGVYSFVRMDEFSPPTAFFFFLFAVSLWLFLVSAKFPACFSYVPGPVS